MIGSVIEQVYDAQRFDAFARRDCERNALAKKKGIARVVV
jgi:hypothetical protein